MAKRFTDTEKWKKPFVKGLDHAHKLLWFYLLDDCNHAGIWQADWEVVEIRIGKFEPEAASKVFGDRVLVLDGGQKWFIRDFIDFQYGTLNPANRLHLSVLEILKKYKIKDLASPLQGANDKDKDKDKVQEKDPIEEKLETCWAAYPTRRQDGASTAKGSKDRATMRRILEKGGYDLLAAIQHHVRTCNGYPKNLTTFLNNLPDPASMAPPPKPPGPAKKPAHVHHFIEQEGKTICALCGVLQPPELPT